MRGVCFLASILAFAFHVDASAAGAQSNCASSARGASMEPADGEWSGALARRVSLHGHDVSLREALDRLAATARIRLSYTAELLPLTRAVCLAYESASVGSVLTDLLVGTTLEPVAAGSDQVVLAPAPQRTSTPSTPPMVTMFRSVGVLDRVVVTGSAAGGSQRSLPIALDVISGQQLSQRDAGSLSTALDGSVPGLWLWEQSPLSLLARYGSIRGASSFGVSYPKVYVDGIEVANSLLVTRLDPEAVSRVEVIRGPQGAALYGADAISGVINIVTRQEGTEGGAPRAQLSTTGGTSSSEFAAGNVLAQSHSLSLRSGSGVRSARLGVTLTSLGAFIPDAFSRQLSANGGVRLVGARSILTGTFRFFGQDARTPSSPLLAALTVSTANAAQTNFPDTWTNTRSRGYRSALDSMAERKNSLSRVAPGDSSDRQSVRQYTVGAVATFRPGDRWTNSAVLGFDGYRLKSGTVLDGAFPSASDSALRAARGTATRGTARASTVGQFGDTERASATVTLAAEYSLMRDRTDTDAPFALYRPPEQGGGGGGAMGSTGPASTIVNNRSNTGLIAQANAAYHDDLFLSTGLRLERNTGLAGIGEYETLPMVGAAFVRSLGFATVKLRSAYGKGIRPPQTTSRAGTLMGLNRSPASVALSAEKQSGIEAGADVFVGHAMVFHVTRFDQRASGLIQPVSVARPPGVDTLRPRRIAYELQNVGEITNRGWELEGAVNSGPLSLSATYASVDSRVEKLANGYTGDLRQGDRMLEVPSRTIGLNASINEKRWHTSWSLSRASDWVNYDRLALTAAFQNENHPLGEFLGAQLRTYWRKYDGVTRLGGNFGYTLSRELSVTLRGENLLDKQEGEPDNITVLPGRTVTAGVRLSF
jgi:outer membrane receptor protein involved in Fe transport